MPDYSVDFRIETFNLDYKINFFKSGGSAAALCDGYVADTVLLNAIAGMLSYASRISEVSVANLDGKGLDTRSRSTGYSYHGLVAEDRNPDVGTTGVRFSLFGEENGRRKLTLTGLPDIFVQRNNDGSPLRVASYVTAETAFINAIKAQDFAIRVLDRDTPTGATAWKVVNYMAPDSTTVNATPVENPAYTVFHLDGLDDHGIQVDDHVVFRVGEDAKELRDIPYIGKVLRRSLTTIVLATPVNFRGNQYFPVNLKVRKATYTLDTIQDIFFDDFISRQRGEGGGPRGKASAKR